jgi:hypothetical protein
MCAGKEVEKTSRRKCNRSIKGSQKMSLPRINLDAKAVCREIGRYLGAFLTSRLQWKLGASFTPWPPYSPEERNCVLSGYKAE